MNNQDNIMHNANRSNIKVPFTADEETLLVKYLAVYNPGLKNRTGEKIFQRLCDDVEKKWKWSKTHPWQSWQNHYKKNHVYYDKRIRKYQEKHTLPTEAPKPQKTSKKANTQAGKRKRREEEGDSSDEEDKERVVRAKTKRRLQISVAEPDEEQETPKSKPRPAQEPAPPPKTTTRKMAARRRPPSPSSEEDSGSGTEDEAPRGSVASNDYQGAIFGSEADDSGDQEDVEQEEAEEEEVEGELGEVEDMLSHWQGGIQLPKEAEDVPRTSESPGPEQSENDDPEAQLQEKIYPDLKQAPSPHLTQRIPTQVGNGLHPHFNARQTFASTPLQVPPSREPVASSSKIRLDSAHTAVKPTVLNGKPKLKPKVVEDPFFDSTPGSPATVPDSHRAKAPQVFAGPFRTSFEKLNRRQQTDTEDEDDDQNKAWPPPRVRNRSGAYHKKGKEKAAPVDAPMDVEVAPLELERPPRPIPRPPSSIAPQVNSHASPPPEAVTSPNGGPVTSLPAGNSWHAPTNSYPSHPVHATNSWHAPTSASPRKTPRVSDTTGGRPAPSASSSDRQAFIGGAVAEKQLLDLYGLSSKGTDYAPTFAKHRTQKDATRQPKSDISHPQKPPVEQLEPVASTSTPTNHPLRHSAHDDPFLTHSLPAKRNPSGPIPDYVLNKPRTAASTPSDITMSGGTSGRYIDLRREASKQLARQSLSAPRQAQGASIEPNVFTTPDHDQSMLLYSAEKSARRSSLVPSPPKEPQQPQVVAAAPPLPPPPAIVEDTENRRRSMLPFPVPEGDSVLFEYLGHASAIQNIGHQFGLRDSVVERAYAHFRDIQQVADFCRRYRERTDSVVDQIVEEMEKEKKGEEAEVVVVEQKQEQPKKKPIQQPQPQPQVLAIQDRGRNMARSAPPSSSPLHTGSKEKQLEIKPLPSDDDNLSEYTAPSSSRAGQFDRLVKQGRKEEALRRESRRASGIVTVLPEIADSIYGDSPTPRTRLSQPAKDEEIMDHQRSPSRVPVEGHEIGQETEVEGQGPRGYLTPAEQMLFIYPDRHNFEQMQNIEVNVSKDFLMTWVASGLSEFRFNPVNAE